MNARPDHNFPEPPLEELVTEFEVEPALDDKTVDQGSDADTRRPAPAQSRTCILDAHDDLWLSTYGPSSWGNSDPVKFKVCSRGLARASVVFDAMLYGRFAELEKRMAGGDWTINLPNDSGAAMRQLLGMMHGRFRSLAEPYYRCEEESVPGDDEASPEPKAESRDITIEQLYDLTVLADKYDCVHMLQPWAKAWIQDLEPLSPWLLSESALLRKTWVYYRLGDRENYDYIVTSLIKDVPPSLA
ncbi:uncharacterized protein B0I36DRAFT_356961 [Microdochium trichocladiopsis]|uniref:BTB domain-containing protein n=1 Tax=Microdochium trichocladiopsis TaxID=1682393 RepID=A0A9P8YFH9_9PEZI|nr:uncharacterized protein B0I36DRAFT_356961 [Microdochium trichocladiopsis]KAH7039546.1 hypothetical protein B0I36DRAFT_356961 [Microdochium trichocladiopsis]